MDKLNLELGKTKERILNINKNLKLELDNYSSNRTANLKKIMSYSCYADSEIGKKLTEFAAGRQKDFPVLTFPEPTATANHEDVFEDKKVDDPDEFESV